jgi:hypothetical protein
MVAFTSMLIGTLLFICAAPGGPGGRFIIKNQEIFVIPFWVKTEKMQKFENFYYMFAPNCGKLKEKKMKIAGPKPGGKEERCFKSESWWCTAPPACAGWRGSPGWTSPAETGASGTMSSSPCGRTG